MTGHFSIVHRVAFVISIEIGLDLLFYLWSLLLYRRRWVGPGVQVTLALAVVAALIEPFSFQMLRHAGAALGWISFLTRQRRWGSQKRTGLIAPMQQ